MKVEAEHGACVTGVLKKLDVSKSGYYDFLKRKPCKQKQKKEELTVVIKEVHQESKEIYGAPKIAKILNNSGIKVSEKQVGNIMRELGLKAHYIRPYTITTKDCDFSSELKNELNRNFNPDKPNAAWCTDITYIWTKEEGFVYLTSVMDLFSRKIIAWTLSKTMAVEEVLKCIRIAKSRRQNDEALIIHSDRGSQYTSSEYQELVSKIKASYSRKGNCWDNACIESFHALIKREWLYRFVPEDYDQVYQLVFEYIEGFYNTIRIHSHCDYISPNDYEKQYQEKTRAA